MSVAVEDTVVLDEVRDVDPTVVMVPAEPVEISANSVDIAAETNEISSENVEITTESTEIPVETVAIPTEPTEISTKPVESPVEADESKPTKNVITESADINDALSENIKDLKEQIEIAPIAAETSEKQLDNGVVNETQPLTAKQRKAQKWLEKLAEKKAERKAVALEQSLTTTVVDDAAAPTTTTSTIAGITENSTEQTQTLPVKESKAQRKKKNKAAASTAASPMVDALLSMSTIAPTAVTTQHSDAALTVPPTELPLPARKKKPSSITVTATPSTTTTTTATAGSENIPHDSSKTLPTTTSTSVGGEETKKKPKNKKKKIPEEPSAETLIPTASTVSKASLHDQIATTSVTPNSVTKHSSTTANLVQDQMILLHSILTILQQSVYHKEAYIYTQQSAMCMYLQTELCRLGYSCIEGDEMKFQYITWFPESRSANSTGIIYNSLFEYPINKNKKGDIKINTPELFIQCCCYPNYGVNSPYMMNMKTFRKKFLTSIQDIAIGNSDSFVFILTEAIYEDYAIVSLPVLPIVSAVKGYLSAYTLPYQDSKTNIQYELKVLITTVDTGNGKYIVAAVHA